MKRSGIYSALLCSAIAVHTSIAGAQPKPVPSSYSVNPGSMGPGLSARAPMAQAGTPAPGASASSPIPIPGGMQQAAPGAPSIAPPGRPMTEKERKQAQLNLDMINAAFRGETWNVRNLLAKGAKINAVDHQYGFSALMWASKKGNLGTVRLLLSKGAKPNLRSFSGVRMLLEEVTTVDKPIYVKDGEVMRWYQRYYRNYWVSENGGVNALVLAATPGYNLTVRELLAHGADPNQTTADGETPLMSAAFSGNLPAVQALVEHGAKLNAVDKTNQTALIAALSTPTRSESVVRYLLSKGIRTDIVWSRFNLTAAGVARAQGMKNLAAIIDRADKANKAKAAAKNKTAAKRAA